MAPIRSVPDADTAWGTDLRSVINIVNQPVHAVGASGSALTLDAAAAAGWIKTITLTGNVTLTFSGATSGYAAVLDLILTQDGTGGRTITWPASVKWLNSASAPTLSTAAAAVNRIQLTSVDGGVTWYGELVSFLPPTGSVTDAMIAAAAAINVDKTADGTTNKAFLATERTKLTGVATGATANSSDATLLARANHTGTQSADTLTDGTTNKAFLATERTKLAAVGVVRTVAASAGTISIDANAAGNNIDTSLSADATLNVPTNGAAGQVLCGSVLASGAQRILTFHASFGLLTGIAATLTIASGKVGRYAIRRTDVTGSARWLVEAAAAEQ